ncbi:hypothetical protein Tco_0516246 [Tanacetum coccineum]
MENLKEHKKEKSNLEEHKIWSEACPNLARGIGYISRGGIEINAGKQRKAKVPRKKRTITVADNILEDADQALELAMSVNLEEERKILEELRVKERHASLIAKGLREGSGVKLNITTYIDADSDSFDIISWTHNKKIDDDDYDVRDDQTRSYGIHVHVKEQEQPTFKPHSLTLTCSS